MASKLSSLGERTAKHFTQTEWNYYKDTIVAASAGRSLKELVVHMRSEHQFSASLSQYEAQFRKWKQRKNLKVHEWNVVLERIRDLEARNIQYKVLISGLEVTRSKIKRSARHCQQRAAHPRPDNQIVQAESFDGLRQVTLKTLSPNGSWVLQPLLAVGSPEVLDGPFQNDKLVSLGMVVPDPVQNSDDAMSFAGRFEMESFTPDVYTALEFGIPIIPSNRVSHEDVHPDMGIMELDLSSTFSDVSSSTLLDCSVDSWSQTFAPFPPLAGRSRTGFFPSLFSSLIAELKGLGVAWSLPIRVTSARNQVQAFLSLVEESLNDSEESFGQTSAVPPGASMKLFPIVARVHAENALQSSDAIFGTSFNRHIIQSIANGFQGMERFPMKCCLRYLKNDTIAGALLSGLLRSRPMHMSKSLAENIFRAAIEDKDVASVRQILSLKLVDVNSIILDSSGTKSTPLGLAARHSCFDLVQVLLNAKADVHKAHTDDHGFPGSGALGLLASTTTKADRLSLQQLETISTLVEAGSRATIKIIMFWARKGLGDLMVALVRQIIETDHKTIMEVCSVSDFAVLTDLGRRMRTSRITHILSDLDEKQTQAILEKFVLTCEHSGCRRCLHDPSIGLESALLWTAMRGFLGPSLLLLPHARNYSSVLSAAIRGGNQQIVHAVQALGPDLCAGAHYLLEHFEDRWTEGPERPEDLNQLDYTEVELWTTPLAEAVLAGDEEMMSLMEEAGALDNLDSEFRFGCVITAATKTGDICYIRKLFRKHPYPRPKELGQALFLALEDRHDELASILLYRGADTSFSSPLPTDRWEENKVFETPLYHALSQRNEGVARTILNSDPPNDQRFIDPVYQKAIEWGNGSILADLSRCFPSYKFPASLYRKFLVTEDPRTIDRIIHALGIAPKQLTEALEACLGTLDLQGCERLIELGADPLDPRVLATASEKNPSMLGFLLQPRSNQSSPATAVGNRVLLWSIKHGPSGFDAVEALLKSAKVDLSDLHVVPNRKDFGWIQAVLDVVDVMGNAFSTLGVAICRSLTAYHADFHVIKMLIEAGSSPNESAVCDLRVYSGTIEPIRNETAFSIAVGSADKSLIELLIRHGADVNQSAKLGKRFTPLQIACKTGSLEIVELLLGAGADVNGAAAERRGGTALQMAAITGDCEMATLLLERGASLHAEPSKGYDGRWPIEGAAEHGRIEMIELLWNWPGRVSDFGYEDLQCRRAMKLAEENGHLACRDYIAELSSVSVPASITG